MSDYRIARSILIGLAIAILAGPGCTWVHLADDAGSVKILDPGEVEDCEQIGRTRSKTKTKILFVTRNKNKVLEEQTTLARNEAARMGGNAVAVKGDAEGQDQLFGIYKCPGK